MNYSEMSDAQINDAVAIARGSLIRKGKALSLYQVEGADLCTDFCNSWADAGPIIENENISLTCHQSRDEWAAIFNRNAMAAHSNPLRAAMECYLMKKGQENAA